MLILRNLGFAPHGGSGSGLVVYFLLSLVCAGSPLSKGLIPSAGRDGHPSPLSCGTASPAVGNACGSKSMRSSPGLGVLGRELQRCLGAPGRPSWVRGRHDPAPPAAHSGWSWAAGMARGPHAELLSQPPAGSGGAVPGDQDTGTPRSCVCAAGVITAPLLTCLAATRSPAAPPFGEAAQNPSLGSEVQGVGPTSLPKAIQVGGAEVRASRCPWKGPLPFSSSHGC